MHERIHDRNIKPTFEEAMSFMDSAISNYAKACMDNSPWRHVGIVDYRAVTKEHLDDLKIMLNCRANQKYREKQTK